MQFHVLTLFPEMIEACCRSSILGRAQDEGLIRISAINIRDYSHDKHGHVDDAPFGGGAGMIMQAGPICEAYEDLCLRCGYPSEGPEKPRVIFLSPKGKTFSQQMVRELAQEETLVFLCGHYEGVDQRAVDAIVTDEVSIGDYVLTGGELAAAVMIDAISRYVPGVLGNDTSTDEESFSGMYLEYPQYTRPRDFRGQPVPDVLLSGNHEAIRKWRLQQSMALTLRVRPDLLDPSAMTQEERKLYEHLREKQKENLP